MRVGLVRLSHLLPGTVSLKRVNNGVPRVIPCLTRNLGGDGGEVPTTQAILFLRGAVGRRHEGFLRKQESRGRGRPGWKPLPT